METWILIAAIVVPVLVTIFGDDLRKLRRVLTFAFAFVRGKRNVARKWYARCEERDFAAKLVNNPEETTPVFIGSLLDSEKRVHWSTQNVGLHAFLLGALWKYRGFCASLGWNVGEGDDSLTWAVVPPQVFLSVSGRKPSRASHWTGSALIEAATTYVDELIEESGVAEYTPSRRFRFLRWLRNLILKPKVQR